MAKSECYPVGSEVKVTYTGHRNPQVETTILRGVESEGFWAPLGAVYWDWDKDKREKVKKKAAAYYLFRDFKEKLNKDGERLCITR